MNTHENFPFAKLLLSWYDKQGRNHLPWRQTISAYRVWVSEIMLQQTQVKTVIPYFERFIARFPTVNELAHATEDEVLHLWTGLGYYARGRNLHRAAQYIVNHHNGLFPTTLEDIQALPGIGRSTAGAILAIATGRKAAILDGNVKRVLARFHRVVGVPSQTTVTKQLWELAEQYTPEKQTADYTQAIMDLGALICTRTKPLCELCPVASGCQAYLHHDQDQFPTPKPRKIIPLREINMLIFHDKKSNRVFLEKRPPVGIWGGLWGFPECAIDTNIIEWCATNLHIKVEKTQTLAPFKHTFSHFQLMINPIYISHYHETPGVMDSDSYIWYTLDTPTARGFAAPVKQLLTTLVKIIR